MVFGLRKSAAPISLLDRPWAVRIATRVSCDVSGSFPAAGLPPSRRAGRGQFPLGDGDPMRQVHRGERAARRGQVRAGGDPVARTA